MMTKRWNIQKNGFCKLPKNNGIQKKFCAIKAYVKKSITKLDRSFTDYVLINPTCKSFLVQAYIFP